MTKILLSLYHFLGSIYFALILIAITALCTAIGTVVEAKTASHMYAIFSIYNSPLFLTLLSAFFLNILISALRRWPFKIRHIPFLITHLGLLMILAGVMVKNLYGLQALLPLAAGSENSIAHISQSYSLSLQKGDIIRSYPLKLDQKGFLVSPEPFKELNISLIASAPHCTESLENWFYQGPDKQNYLCIQGYKPLLVDSPKQPSDLQPKISIPIHFSSGPLWDIYALESENISETVNNIFVNNTQVMIKNKSSSEELIKKPLNSFINDSVAIGSVIIKSTLELDFLSVAHEGKNGCIKFTLSQPDTLQNSMTLPLNGPHAALNIWKENFFYKPFNLSIDLESRPTLAWIKEKVTNKLYLFAINSCGEIYTLLLSLDKPTALISYEQGLGGYAQQINIPFAAYHTGRQLKEAAALALSLHAIEESLEKKKDLPFALQLLFTACHREKDTFIAILKNIFSQWHRSSALLFPIELPGNYEINWEDLPKELLQTLSWTHKFASQIHTELENNISEKNISFFKSWPFALPNGDIREKIGDIYQKIYAIKEQLPSLPLSQEAKKELFSLCCLLTSLSPDTLFLFPDNEKESKQMIHQYYLSMHPSSEEASFSEATLETPLIYSYKPQPFQEKMEENRPLIKLLIQEKGGQSQTIALRYEPFTEGLKWPILSGHYLIRFQPLTYKLPWNIRLQDALQVNYPGTNQPFSFESTLLFSNPEKKIEVEATLSMNYVYETYDHYRFYLSSLTPSDQTSLQNVMLVVNRDPGKYFFTYPGALILSIGIALFLWQQSRRLKN